MKLHHRISTKRLTTFATITAACLAVGLTAAGCGSTSSSTASNSGSTGSPTSSSAGGSSLNGKSVYLLSCVDSNAFCGAYNNYVSQQLGHLGAKVTVLNANFDPVQQAQQFDQALAAKPDLIIIQVADPSSIVPEFRKAQMAHVPVINSIGRQLPISYGLLTASVECNCTALGQQAAQNVVAGLQKEGIKSGNVVAITGAKAQFIAQDRITSFRAAIAKTPQYKLVAVQDGNWDDSTSANLYRQLYAKYKSQGGIQAAWGMADNQANAIIGAAKQLGQPVGVKHKGLIVIGTSCQPLTLNNLKSGDQFAGSTNSPITEAKPTVAAATQFLKGQQIPKITRANESIVTATNIDQFAGECNFG